MWYEVITTNTKQIYKRVKNIVFNTFRYVLTMENIEV